MEKVTRERWCAELECSLVIIWGQYLRGGRSLGPLGSAGRWEHLQSPRGWSGHCSFSFRPVRCSSPCMGCSLICTCWAYWKLMFSQKKLLLEQVCIGGSTVICFAELVKSPSFLPEGHAGRRSSAKIQLLGISFHLCLKWTYFCEDSLPVSLQYASWAHKKSTRKTAILVHAKHFISNTWSLGFFYWGLVCL